MNAAYQSLQTSVLNLFAQAPASSAGSASSAQVSMSPEVGVAVGAGVGGVVGVGGGRGACAWTGMVGVGRLCWWSAVSRSWAAG